MTTLTSFKKFIGTDFEPDILPVIPADAELKPDSLFSPDHLGRIPGKYLVAAGSWVGFADWQTHEADHFDLQRWKSWQTPGMRIAVGLNTRRFHAFGIDSDKPKIACTLEILISMCMGAAAAVRLRHGSFRRVLFYEREQNTVPIPKHRLAFKDADGDQRALEFLAYGQQVVIEGPHATGAMHYWRDGIGLVEGRQRLAANEVTGEIVAATIRTISDWADKTKELEKMKLSPPTIGNRFAAVKVADIRLRSPSHLTRLSVFGSRNN